MLTCNCPPHPVTGVCMKCASGETLRSLSSYDPTDEGKLLRVSKSSFMGYLYCPRQYFMDRVLLKDIKKPATTAMTRGTEVHDALDDFYDRWNGEQTLYPMFDQLGNVYRNMATLEQQRLDAWGAEYFAPYEHEELRVYYHEEYDIVIVGKIDGVLIAPDEEFAILELKTGTTNENKITKTRKELAFYYMVLKDMDDIEATRFVYVLPDADNHTFVNKLMQQKNKTVWVGDDGGMTVIEKVNQRTLNSFRVSFEKFLQQIQNEEWAMNWDDWRCPQWCSYSMACEEEITGISYAEGFV